MSSISFRPDPPPEATLVTLTRAMLRAGVTADELIELGPHAISDLTAYNLGGVTYVDSLAWSRWLTAARAARGDAELTAALTRASKAPEAARKTPKSARVA